MTATSAGLSGHAVTNCPQTNLDDAGSNKKSGAYVERILYLCDGESGGLSGPATKKTCAWSTPCAWIIGRYSSFVLCRPT